MIETAFIVAFVVLFMHVTTWEGMINEWVGKALFNAPEWIKKPLYDCPICMAPWWGSVCLAAMCLYSSEWLNPVSWIILVFSAGGINAVLIYIISSNKEETKLLKEENEA